jgi:hypothetical protein
MDETPQVGLPGAEFEVEIVLAIAAVRGGGGPRFPCRLRTSSGYLYGESHAEQQKKGSNGPGIHGLQRRWRSVGLGESLARTAASWLRCASAKREQMVCPRDGAGKMRGYKGVLAEHDPPERVGRQVKEHDATPGAHD